MSRPRQIKINAKGSDIGQETMTDVSIPVSCCGMKNHLQRQVITPLVFADRLQTITAKRINALKSTILIYEVLINWHPVPNLGYKSIKAIACPCKK